MFQLDPLGMAQANRATCLIWEWVGFCNKTDRMNIESRTVSVMIRIYCRAHHGAEKNLCEDCAGLLAYALERIAECPFGDGKPVCNQCAVHCYQPGKRGRIKEIMRYAGPRMIWWHPMLAARHLLRSRRTED